jgi:S-adenosyl-methyltransferase mraW
MEYNNHVPVMLKEVLSFVPKRQKITYLDMTLGRAGHAENIIQLLQDGSTLIGVDRDPAALAFSQERLCPYLNVKQYFLHSTFASAINTLKKSGIEGADFILMDIGVSSPQFDDPSRGFSYRFDAPLDMRMDPNDRITAKDIINSYDEKELCRVFRELGQCKIYYPVVKKILTEREKKPIETTFELVDIIKSALPAKELRQEGHPAKQFFLGLRYEVNGEITQLKKGIQDAIHFLNHKGRLVVISFNSEEDKIVKDAFKQISNESHVDKYAENKCTPDGYKTLTKKPLVPTEEEIKENNRAKASILRVLERN